LLAVALALALAVALGPTLAVELKAKVHSNATGKTSFFILSL
jgi:hypothetical protein